MVFIIVSPEKTETHEIAWFEAHTLSGNMVIQPKHAPTILLLEPGKELLFCLKSGKQESIMIPRGIVEVTRDKATVIINKPLT
jgi:F0F1-type ATP synthase epsilon subunit